MFLEDIHWLQKSKTNLCNRSAVRVVFTLRIVRSLRLQFSKSRSVQFRIFAAANEHIKEKGKLEPMCIKDDLPDKLQIPTIFTMENWSFILTCCEEFIQR